MRGSGAPSSIVGVEQATVRRRCVPGAHGLPWKWNARARSQLRVARTVEPPGATMLRMAMLGAATLGALSSAPLAAQDGAARVQQVHRADEPEGRLLAFYSAAMLFTSLGVTAMPGRWSLGVEATLIPTLSEAQRRPGIDKPETTNLSPVLPRPRATLRLGDAVVEGSWIPPVTVGDARANLGALALSRRVGQWRAVTFVPRLSVVAGRVQGAITCNARTAQEGGADLATYYAAVCHGRESDDWFEPRLVAGEVVAQREWGAGRALWLAAGGRVDRSRFDIGVTRTDGTRDLDHPILKLHDTQWHATGGARWTLGARLSTAVEAFYAPGSMLTVRTLFALMPRGR